MRYRAQSAISQLLMKYSDKYLAGMGQTIVIEMMGAHKRERVSMLQITFNRFSLAQRQKTQEGTVFGILVCSMVLYLVLLRATSNLN